MYEGNDAPVKVGEEIEVKIDAVGEKGDGIARKDGFVLFVPNTRAGDVVKIKITKVLQKVGFAEVVGEGTAPEPEKQRPVHEDLPDEPDVVSAEDTEDFGEDIEEDQ